MQLKMFKDLTVEDLERMRAPELLGREADTLIAALYKVTEGRGLSDEETRRLTLSEAFSFEQD
jgi:hypothetical protein